MMRRPFKALRRLWRREDGTASLEFCLIFPAFILLFVSSFEIAMANIRMAMLERATDMSVRALRLNTGAPPSYEDMRRMICSIAGIIPDCLSSVRIELEPVSTSAWNQLTPEARCIDRASNIDPLTTFRQGIENELMMVRVCAVVKPFFPTFGLGSSLPVGDSGEYKLVTISAFVNEPD